jgi:hypothetical protein
VVHRYMQVTQAKTKRSFKTLDATISVTDEHGDVNFFPFFTLCLILVVFRREI